MAGTKVIPFRCCICKSIPEVMVLSSGTWVNVSGWGREKDDFLCPRCAARYAKFWEGQLDEAPKHGS